MTRHPAAGPCRGTGLILTFAAAMFACAVASAAQVGSTDVVLDAALLEKTQSVCGRVLLSTTRAGQAEVTIDWIDNYNHVADRQVTVVTLPGQTSVPFCFPADVGLTMLNRIVARAAFIGTNDTLAQSTRSWSLVPDPIDHEDYHANVWGIGDTGDPDYFNAIRLAHVNLGHIYRSNPSFYGPQFNVRPNHDFIEDKRWFEMTDAMHDPNYNIYDAALRTTNDYYLPARRAALIRPQSLSSAASLNALISVIVPRMQQSRPWRPMQWNIADEYGLGRRDYPFDYDLGPDSIAQFVAWLQGEYGTIDALNAQWGTHFASWDDLRDPINAPRYGEAALIITQEMKDREYPLYSDATGAKNFSPWSDFRRHMELTMAAAMQRCVDAARAIDPTVPVGWEGGETVTPLNGYDYWLQMPLMGSFEAYDLSNSPEYARSFRENGYGERLFRWITMFNSGSARSNRYQLWYHLIHHGQRASIIWWYEDFFSDTSSFALTSYATGLAPAYGEFRAGLAKLLSQGEHDDGEVALYYSQRSAHVEWMHDSEPLGRNWLSQKSGDRLIRTGLYAQTGWLKALEDVGIKGRFLSYEQIANGELISRGYRILIMPRVMAMSPEEIAAVQAFAEAGGLVIADNQTALYDGHGKRRSIAEGGGLMDQWFGIQRIHYASTERNRSSSDAYAGGVYLQTPPPGFEPLVQGLGAVVSEGWHAVESGVRVADGTAVGRFGGDPDKPVLIVRNHGLGKSIYVNLTLMRYGRSGSNYSADRNRPGDAAAGAVRRLVRNLMAVGGVAPKVRVLQGRDAPDTAPEVYNYEKARYVDGAITYLACVVNSYLQDANLSTNQNLGGMLFGQSGATQPHVTLVLDEPAHVYDVRQRTYLGHGTRINAQVAAYEGSVFALLPYPVAGLDIESISFDAKRRATIRAAVRTSAPQPLGRHVLRLSVTNRTGQDLTHLTRNVVAPGGAWEDLIPFGVTEDIVGGTIRLTDVATGAAAQYDIRAHDLLAGDVDGDGEVTVTDITAVIASFGSVPSDERWDADCDFDRDGEISVIDVVTSVTHFGEHL